MRFLALIGAVGLLVSGPAFAAPKEVAAHKAWKAYVSEDSGGKVCFVLSAPQDQSPKNVKRGDVFFVITNWGDGHWQPSLEIGYPFKPSSEAAIKVGSDKFNMFTKNDDASGNGGAWIRDKADETRLVRAMKRGSSMIVSGTSKRGTLTTDRYSLSGITAALDAAEKACK